MLPASSLPQPEEVGGRGFVTGAHVPPCGSLRPLAKPSSSWGTISFPVERHCDRNPASWGLSDKMAPLQTNKRQKAQEGGRAVTAHEFEPGPEGAHEERDKLLNPVSPSPSSHFNAALQQCVYPHILSYNTFADCYVEEMVKELPFIYIDPNYEPDRHEANPYYKPAGCTPIPDSF